MRVPGHVHADAEAYVGAGVDVGDVATRWVMRGLAMRSLVLRIATGRRGVPAVNGGW